jgi:thiamine pyrophosphokinase
MKRAALVFANGDLNDGEALRATLAATPDPYVIAADGGARNALACNLTPNLVIGDFDSLTPAELRLLSAQGAEIRRYPAEKNETDLELVLLAAVALGCDPIRVIGGVGDRIDQTLANLYLLSLPPLQNQDVRLVSGKQTAWLAYPGETSFSGSPGDTVSLLPFGGEVQGVQTEGLYYPLKREALRFGPARGISNVMNDKIARIQFEAGILLVVHTLGRA